MINHYYYADVKKDNKEIIVFVVATIRKSPPVYFVKFYEYDNERQEFVHSHGESSRNEPITMTIDIKKRIADYFKVNINDVDLSIEYNYNQWKNRIKNEVKIELSRLQ